MFDRYSHVTLVGYMRKSRGVLGSLVAHVTHVVHRASSPGRTAAWHRLIHECGLQLLLCQ